MKRTKAISTTGDFTSVKNLVLSRDLSGNFLSTVFMVTPLGCSLSDARFRKLLAFSEYTWHSCFAVTQVWATSLDLAGFGQLLRSRVTSGDLRRRGEKSRSEVKFGRNRSTELGRSDGRGLRSEVATTVGDLTRSAEDPRSAKLAR